MKHQSKSKETNENQWKSREINENQWKSMKILDKRVDDILLGKKGELLWVVEHNSVYTAGSSSKDEDLLDKKLNVINTPI